VADKQRAVLKKLAYGGFRPADDGYLDQVREMYGVLAVADAEKAGDRARLAKAQADLDKIRARMAQARATDAGGQ